MRRNFTGVIFAGIERVDGQKRFRMDLQDFLPLAEYARQRNLKLSTLAARVQRGNIPADCVHRVGRTVLIRNQDYTPPTGNLKGAPRSGGGRKPKVSPPKSDE